MRNNFKNVLFVGPTYLNHRGGMGAVLEIYALHIEPFKFISSYPEKSTLKNTLHFLKCTLKYARCLINDNDIEIVHLHSAAKGSFYRKSVLAIIGKIFHKKVIMHIHSGAFREYYFNCNTLFKTYINFVVKISDRIICISDEAYSFFAELSPLNNVLSLDNPIELNEKSNNKPVGFPIHMLFLSRINTNKGAFDLIELINSNQEYYRGKILLNMAGDGEIEKLQRVIKTYGISDIVKFNGWVIGAQKSKLISDCDVLILPSYFEELPMTILEAMSFGKPIISTNVGGISKVVKPYFNGWLVKPGDIKALNSILKSIIRDPQLLLIYGNNSYEIINQYSSEIVMEKLEVIYECLLRKQEKNSLINEAEAF